MMSLFSQDITSNPSVVTLSENTSTLLPIDVVDGTAMVLQMEGNPEWRMNVGMSALPLKLKEGPWSTKGLFLGALNLSDGSALLKGDWMVESLRYDAMQMYASLQGDDMTIGYGVRVEDSDGNKVWLSLGTAYDVNVKEQFKSKTALSENVVWHPTLRVDKEPKSISITYEMVKPQKVPERNVPTRHFEGRYVVDHIAIGPELGFIYDRKNSKNNNEVTVTFRKSEIGNISFSIKPGNRMMTSFFSKGVSSNGYMGVFGEFTSTMMMPEDSTLEDAISKEMSNTLFEVIFSEQDGIGAVTLISRNGTFEIGGTEASTKPYTNKETNVFYSAIAQHSAMKDEM